VETAALQGLGLVGNHTGSQHALLQRAGWGIGLILTGILIQQGYQLWSEQRTERHSVVATTVAELPELLPVSTVSTPPTVVAVVPTRSAETVSAPHVPETKHTKSKVRRIAAAEQPHSQAPAKTKTARIVRKPLTPAQKAQRNYSRAQNLLSSGQIRAAAKYLRAALELNPELGDARLQLTTLYLHQGRADRALQLLEAGDRINPDDTRIAIAHIRLLAEQGEYRRALELMNSRLQQGSVNADTLALAAALHYRMGEFSASASSYREALARNPAQAVWWMGLGVSLENNQQSTEALEAYRHANTTALDTTLKSFVTGRIAALSGRTD